MVATPKTPTRRLRGTYVLVVGADANVELERLVPLGANPAEVQCLRWTSQRPCGVRMSPPFNGDPRRKTGEGGGRDGSGRGGGGGGTSSNAMFLGLGVGVMNRIGGIPDTSATAADPSSLAAGADPDSIRVPTEATPRHIALTGPASIETADRASGRAVAIWTAAGPRTTTRRHICSPLHATLFILWVAQRPATGCCSGAVQRTCQSFENFDGSAVHGAAYMLLGMGCGADGGAGGGSGDALSRTVWRIY